MRDHHRNMSCSCPCVLLISSPLCLPPPSAGPGRERPLRWRFPVHGEPPGAAPTAGADRGHRGLTPTFLPVSRLTTACHTRSITHTSKHARSHAHNGHVSKCDDFFFFFFFPSAICAHQSAARWRFLVSGVRACVRGVGGHYRGVKRGENMHGVGGSGEGGWERLSQSCSLHDTQAYGVTTRKCYKSTVNSIHLNDFFFKMIYFYIFIKIF